LHKLDRIYRKKYIISNRKHVFFLKYATWNKKIFLPPPPPLCSNGRATTAASKRIHKRV
jgi:hypothetical protein